MQNTLARTVTHFKQYTITRHATNFRYDCSLSPNKRESFLYGTRNLRQRLPVTQTHLFICDFTSFPLYRTYLCNVVFASDIIEIISTCPRKRHRNLEMVQLMWRGNFQNHCWVAAKCPAQEIVYPAQTPKRWSPWGTTQKCNEGERRKRRFYAAQTRWDALHLRHTKLQGLHFRSGCRNC